MDKNVIKSKLMEEHKRAVKCAEYQYAKMILYLLRKHRITVGLNDVDYKVEHFCENIGCRIRYGRSYNTAEIRF